MSNSKTPNDIERKLRAKAAEKAALLFAGRDVHTEETCPARLEFGLGVSCGLHPEAKPTQLKKLAISCAIAASTSMAITLAVAAPASSAPMTPHTISATSAKTHDRLHEATNLTSAQEDSKVPGLGKTSAAEGEPDAEGTSSKQSKKTGKDKTDGKSTDPSSTSYWRIFGKRGVSESADEKNTASDSKQSKPNSKNKKISTASNTEPKSTESGQKPTPTGPNENHRTQSSSAASPKVGVALQPANEITAAWRTQLGEDADGADIKKPKGASVPSTLTRAQTVGLTAWLLGDWSTFDGEYSNGKVPEDNLKELLTVRGHELRHDAAIMFDLMCVDFLEEFGHPIGLTDSYRPYESQVSLKERKPGLAAEPGTSNHGWGLAIDMSGQASKWDTPERKWLIDNGWKYGWFSPTWAQKDSSRPESWHFEYMGTTEIAWPTSEEALERIDELNGDPLQGLFVEDIINSLLGNKDANGAGNKSANSEDGQTSGKNNSSEALKRTEEQSREEEQQTGKVILNQGILP